VRDLAKVFETAQRIVAWGMAPIIDKWPEPRQDGRNGYSSIPDGIRSSLTTDGQDDYIDIRVKADTYRWLFRADEDDRGETEEERIARELGEWFEAQAAAEAALAAGLAVQAGQQALVRPTPATVTPQAIRQQSIFVRLLLDRWLGQNPAGAAIDRAADQVDRFALTQLRQVLTIDLRRDIPGMQGIIDQFREANIQLIESGIRGPLEAVPLRRLGLLPDVSQVIEQAHAQGLRVEELQAQLVQRFGVSDARAELIARDQVLTLNSQVSQHRQQQAGITEFTWVTAGDLRVRPSHREINGQAFSYTNPPVVDGESVLPGQPINCRCVAAPVRPAWMQR